MRLAAVALAINLIVVSGFSRPAGATQIVRMDGNWWKSIPSDVRVYVVEGMMLTYQEGYLVGAADASSAVVNDFPQIFGSASGRQTMDKISRPPEPKFSKTFGIYVDEISDYYANNPDIVSKIEIGEVFRCLADDAPPKCLDTATANAKAQH